MPASQLPLETTAAQPVLPDPAYRAIRLVFAIFYVLALPALVISSGIVTVLPPILWNPDLGTAERISALLILLTLGLFIVTYFAMWFIAPRITQPKWAWLPFGASVPPLLAFVIFSQWQNYSSPAQRLQIAAYPAVLLMVLAIGIFLSIRTHLRSRVCNAPARPNSQT